MVLELRRYVKLNLMILKHTFRIIVYRLDTKLIRLRIKFIDYCWDHDATTHWFYRPILRWYLKLGRWLDDSK